MEKRTTKEKVAGKRKKGVLWKVKETEYRPTISKGEGPLGGGLS